MCPRRACLLVVTLLGCGTPSQHLTTRIVDDPVVLPRRMLQMGVAVQVQRPDLRSGAVGQLNYGLGHRLELAGLLSLRWAILEETPANPDERPDRLSLAVRGGAEGIGSSSIEGLTVLPVAGVEVRKRLGSRTRLSLSTTWEGKWVESPAGWLDSYGEDLRPTSSRLSLVTVAAEVFRQLGDHVALGAGASAHQLERCTLPSCSWASRGGELWLGPHVRPRRWVTLALHLSAGGRYRPAGLPLQSPDEPIAHLADSVSWVGALGAVVFQW
jgi:hypothetical protein